MSNHVTSGIEINKGNCEMMTLKTLDGVSESDCNSLLVKDKTENIALGGDSYMKKETVVLKEILEKKLDEGENCNSLDGGEISVEVDSSTVTVNGLNSDVGYGENAQNADISVSSSERKTNDICKSDPPVCDENSSPPSQSSQSQIDERNTSCVVDIDMVNTNTNEPQPPPANEFLNSDELSCAGDQIADPACAAITQSSTSETNNKLPTHISSPSSNENEDQNSILDTSSGVKESSCLAKADCQANSSSDVPLSNTAQTLMPTEDICSKEDSLVDCVEQSTFPDSKSPSNQSSFEDDVLVLEADESTTSKDVLSVEANENTTTKDVVSVETSENTTTKDVVSVGISENTTTNDVVSVEANENATTNDVVSVEANENTTTNDVVSVETSENTTTNDVSVETSENATTNDVVSVETNESTTSKDVINVDTDENTAHTDVMDMDVTETEQDVVCLGEPLSTKQGSRISVLEFPKKTKLDSPDKDSDAIEINEGVSNAELMDVRDDDKSPVVNTVEKSGSDVDMCVSDSVLNGDVTTEMSGGICPEMEQDSHDNRLLNGDGENGCDVQGVSISSVEGAHSVGSAEENGDGIKLVSVCSVFGDEKHLKTSNGSDGVVNIGGDIVVNSVNDVNTDGVVLDGSVSKDDDDQEIVNKDVGAVNTGDDVNIDGDAVNLIDKETLSECGTSAAIDSKRSKPHNGKGSSSLEGIAEDADSESDAVTGSSSGVTVVSVESDISCNGAAKESKVVSEKCLVIDEDGDEVLLKQDVEDVKMDDVKRAENDVSEKGKECPGDSMVKDEDSVIGVKHEEKETKVTENEVKACLNVEAVKDSHTDAAKSEVEVSKCSPTEMKNDEVEEQKEDEGKEDNTQTQTSSFKDILKPKKDSKGPSSVLDVNDDDDDDVIILDENDEDSTQSDRCPTKEDNTKASSDRGVSNQKVADGKSDSNFSEVHRQKDEVARKRSITLDDGDTSSPKRSRLESNSPKTGSDGGSKTSPDADTLMMEVEDGEPEPTKAPTKTNDGVANKLGVTLTSAALRSYILSSLKAAIWSTKLGKTLELEERMSKMESASSLWKESSKHLEKSVDELTKFSKEIEIRNAQSQKLKRLSSRSVGVQVTPLTANSNIQQQQQQQQQQRSSQPSSRLPGQPLRSSPQQASSSKSLPSPSSTTTPSPSTQPQQQHRLPPSVLLNHGTGGLNKPGVVSSTTTLNTPAKGRPQTRPGPQTQQVRPPGTPMTQYNNITNVQNQIRNSSRYPQPQGTQHLAAPYPGSRPIRPQPSPSANTGIRPGQPRQPTPSTENNSGVIDLTDEDDSARRPNTVHPTKLYNSNPPTSTNGANRSTAATVYGKGGNTQQVVSTRPALQAAANRTNSMMAQQRLANGNVQSPSSTNQKRVTLTPRPGAIVGGVATLTGRLNGSGPHQTAKSADSSRGNSTAIHSLPPNPSLHSKHPAAFPAETQVVTAPYTAKLKPPKPSLKISRVVKGIVLSWNMPPLNNTEVISSYQLYAYQESAGLPSPSSWKKVGDVKALPLPMACTLTQFQEGNKYHFAVRAVDQFGRWGDYSDPSSIYLYPDGARES